MSPESPGRAGVACMTGPVFTTLTVIPAERSTDRERPDPVRLPLGPQGPAAARGSACGWRRSHHQRSPGLRALPITPHAQRAVACDAQSVLLRDHHVTRTRMLDEVPVSEDQSARPSPPAICRRRTRPLARQGRTNSTKRRQGTVADYIPALAKTPPHLFGVSWSGERPCTKRAMSNTSSRSERLQTVRLRARSVGRSALKKPERNSESTAPACPSTP